MIECDQQSNGSPCQTYEGGLHMPDSASFKEFVKTVRTRRRYHSQCTPEKNINIIGIQFYYVFIFIEFNVFYLNVF